VDEATTSDLEEICKLTDLEITDIQDSLDRYEIPASKKYMAIPSFSHATHRTRFCYWPLYSYIHHAPYRSVLNYNFPSEKRSGPQLYYKKNSIAHTTNGKHS